MVLQGWEDGAIVSFPGLGDEGIEIEAADVEVQVQTEPHDPWAREGSTLYYTARISLMEGLCGTVVEVPTLDGRTLSVPVSQVRGLPQTQLSSYSHHSSPAIRPGCCTRCHKDCAWRGNANGGRRPGRPHPPL